jgi:hypothetical protein
LKTRLLTTVLRAHSAMCSKVPKPSSRASLPRSMPRLSSVSGPKTSSAIQDETIRRFAVTSSGDCSPNHSQSSRCYTIVCGSDIGLARPTGKALRDVAIALCSARFSAQIRNRCVRQIRDSAHMKINCREPCDRRQLESLHEAVIRHRRGLACTIIDRCSRPRSFRSPRQFRVFSKRGTSRAFTSTQTDALLRPTNAVYRAARQTGRRSV